MAVIISGNGIDMGNNPVSNASQIDGVVINENNENVATTSNLVGFKNYIINGNFDVWQRGDSFSPNSSNFFTADRWWLDWSNTATGLSAYKQPGLVSKNSLYILRTGGAKMQAYQMVENQGNLSNKTFTFSALVRSTYNGSVNFKIVDGRFGTNFNYTQTPVTLEANIAKKVVFTVQLGQVSADALFVGIGTTCSDFYIHAVQMEEGSVATPFEQRPIGLELSLCQRYYQLITKSGITSTNTHYYESIINLPVPMRVTPTSTGTFIVTSGNAGTLAISGTLRTVSVYNSASNWTPNVSANADVYLSAEL